MVAEEKRLAKINRLLSEVKKEKEKLARDKKEEKAENNAALSAAFEVICANVTPQQRAKFTEYIKANLTGKKLDRALHHLEKIDTKKVLTTTRTKRTLKKASEIFKEAETPEVAPDTPENQILIQEK